jgi:hypothetical protein
MAISNSAPIRFTPRGIVDAYDATDVFDGACRTLSNLVFDPSNPEIVIPRPGVGNPLTNFAQYSNYYYTGAWGFVSVHIVVGNWVYGMIASTTTQGMDEPFAYNLQTGKFSPISGITAGNKEGRPNSPSLNGAWIPPVMSIIGTKIIITHPGYTGVGSNFFGALDISNPLFPKYTTQNTSTYPLPTVPTGVANLNNRAYFICGNVVYYSDVLSPLSMTNAGQALTLGDTNPVTALSGLPVQTTTAGVIGALICFKSTQIWQVTGDAAVTGSLALNFLSLNIGTTSPRSVVPSPLGTFFAGPDSAYVVTPNGSVVPLTGQLGATSLPYLRQPFGNVQVPSRVCAAYAGNIYRICIPTIIDGVQMTGDYWFDTRRMKWTGPHTFLYDCVSSAGNYFILSSALNVNALFSSNIYPNPLTQYADNGNPFNVNMISASFPKLNDMEMKQVIESTIELEATSVSTAFTFTAYNDEGSKIGTITDIPSFKGKASYTGIGQTGVTNSAVWGTNLWGDGSRWGGITGTLPGGTSGNTVMPTTYSLFWPAPLVFNKIVIQVSTLADHGIAFGTFYSRFQKTGYLLQ